jgi:hypothetical protein
LVDKELHFGNSTPKWHLLRRGKSRKMRITLSGDNLFIEQCPVCGGNPDVNELRPSTNQSVGILNISHCGESPGDVPHALALMKWMIWHHDKGGKAAAC